MAIYRGTGGTGDTSTGEDVFGSNGSITDLNGLTGPIRTPTYIAFDTEAEHTSLVGEVTWNSNEGTLDVGLNGGLVTLQVGQEVHYRVTNQSGLSIADGTLVVYSGTTGNSGRLLIEPYDGTQASKYIIGVTTETIANGADGYVTHFGKVRGIQTNGANYGEVWNDADELYPSPLGLTNVLPVAPAAKQVIGIVINSHPTNGEMVVNVQGHTSLQDDELVHLDTLTNGDILQYDSTDERFENKSLTAAGIQPTLVSGVNIKTVNSTSLVGSGDVQVQAYDANLTSFVNTFTLPTADSTNGSVLTTNGTGTLSLNAPGGIADGDKGDITVSGGGTVWSIDSGVITKAKIANAVFGSGLKGASVASAATTNIYSGADGDLVHITGTTAITSFGTAAAAGDRRTLVIDSAGVVITNGANLICPEGINIVSSAGDVITIVADTTTQHRVVSYARVGTTSFGGSFTRNLASASTTQVITGVGFRPKRVKFYMANPTAGNNAAFSVGEDNGTYATCIYDSTALTATTNAVDTAVSIRGQASTGNQSGKISAFSNDGFTVSWTLNSTGPAFTATIFYVAEG
jgi:hypothetical protein